MTRHISDQCFGTPSSATTLLLRGQARPVQDFSTPDQCYDTHVQYFGTSD